MIFKRKKNLQEVLEKTKNSSLKKTLGPFDLFLMGLGAILGTGIFVMTGIAAAELSGPAVTMSYLIAGIACIFIAFAYTEVATMIPTSGGVYAYSYVSLGEIMAWITGWVMILYFMTSSSAVAIGWSGYIVSLLSEAGIHIPKELSLPPCEGGLINLPAVGISVITTIFLSIGTKESTTLNGILVFVKVLAIFIFIVIAFPHLNIDLWFNHDVSYDSSLLGSSKFMPFGYEGVMAGAALVFFGYNGFDALASASEEAKNPERDLSIGILTSLIFCMIVYMIVSGLLVGLVPFDQLLNDSPLAYALDKIGSNKGSAIVATGAVAGMSTVILIQMFAQSRLIFAMSRDGLLPRKLMKLHHKFNTPYLAIMFIGIVVSLCAGFLPLNMLGRLASTGALFLYLLVAVVMLVLRIRMPEVKRPFKCPAAYIIAPISILLCGYLVYTLLVKVSVYFIGWLALGILIYFLYARKNSVHVND